MNASVLHGQLSREVSFHVGDYVTARHSRIGPRSAFHVWGKWHPNCGMYLHVGFSLFKDYPIRLLSNGLGLTRHGS
jgi:hypothetical protein